MGSLEKKLNSSLSSNNNCFNLAEAKLVSKVLIIKYLKIKVKGF